MSHQPTLSQHPVDMMTFPFTGVAGYLTWYGMQEGLEHLWPATIRAQQHMNGDDVINTLSEGGGNWGHGTGEAYLKRGSFGLWRSYYPILDQQNYVASNKNNAVGYVRNRSYNIYTNGCKDSYFPNIGSYEYHIYNMTHITPNMQYNIFGNKILIVKTLYEKQNYFIDWYHYKTGDYIKTDYIKTNNDGELKLDFPELYAYDPTAPYDGGNPVVWYVVHKDAYTGLMQNETPIEKSEGVVFDFQPIEIDTINNSFHNAIYPNPFEHIITVNSLEDDVFVISTLTGSVIKQINIHKGKNTLFVSSLPKGLYFGELKNQQFITKLERL